MDLLFYDANGRDRRLNPDELAAADPGENNLLWVNGDAEELSRLKLPVSMAAALAEAAQDNGHVRVYEEFYRCTVPVLPPSGEAASLMLTLLVGQDWLVSLGPADATNFDDIIARDAGETMKGALSGTTLAAALLAEHFARFHRHIATIDGEIDRVEQRALTRQEGRNILKVLTVLRRRTARMRQVLSELRPILVALTRPDFLPAMPAEDRVHLLHLEATFNKLNDEIVRLRDTVVGSFELYATRVAQDTNRLLRALTVTTVITGMVAAVAGVFGMNFKIPFFESGEPGFYSVVASMVLLAFTLIGLGLWRKWF